MKYDYDFFGSSSSPDLGKDDVQGGYVRMTAADVDQMFSGLNEFERFTTARYHALRSSRAPTSIGRRRTNFHERKLMRGAPLPSKGTSIAWLAFPMVLVAIWGYNLSKVKTNANSKQNNSYGRKY